jgi:ribosomal 50S subunit-associated protein YjgA (DUF615 family)
MEQIKTKVARLRAQDAAHAARVEKLEQEQVRVKAESDALQAQLEAFTGEGGFGSNCG